MRSLRLAAPIRPVETASPPVRRYHYPFRLRTRWRIVTLRDRRSWADVRRDLRYLVRG